MATKTKDLYSLRYKKTHVLVYLGSVLQSTAKLLVSATLRPTLILRTLIDHNQT